MHALGHNVCVFIAVVEWLSVGCYMDECFIVQGSNSGKLTVMLVVKFKEIKRSHINSASDVLTTPQLILM